MGQEANNKLSKINSVFEFGHGNYNPTLVVFPSYDESIRPCGDIRRSYIASMKTNPVAIACAKYHNVAVTDDGRVYTWVRMILFHDLFIT
jgi:alpha-tubulin suppressor-like RCC1 family protein